MKNVIKHILNGILILAILGSSSGLLINRMDCLITGNTFYSLGDFERCDEPEELAISSNCCGYLQLHLKMELQTLNNSQNENEQKVFTPVSFVQKEIFSFISTDYSFLALFHPPKSTLDFLTYLQVFRL